MISVLFLIRFRYWFCYSPAPAFQISNLAVYFWLTGPLVFCPSFWSKVRVVQCENLMVYCEQLRPFVQATVAPKRIRYDTIIMLIGEGQACCTSKYPLRISFGIRWFRNCNIKLIEILDIVKKYLTSRKTRDPQYSNNKHIFCKLIFHARQFLEDCIISGFL